MYMLKVHLRGCLCMSLLFTRFFVWDSSKANMRGNSFERKMAKLKGMQQSLEAPIRGLREACSTDTTPNGFRSGFMSPIGQRRSPSPAPRVPRSSRKSPTNNLQDSPPQTIRKLFPESPNHTRPVPPSVETSSPNEDASTTEADGNEAGSDIHLQIHPHERSTVISSDPVKGIDVTKREAYLSKEDFKPSSKGQEETSTSFLNGNKTS